MLLFPADVQLRRVELHCVLRHVPFLALDGEVRFVDVDRLRPLVAVVGAGTVARRLVRDRQRQ
jgi:hypothetical protein